MVTCINDLINKYYSERDESHGLNHINAVLKWADILIEQDGNLSEKEKKYIKTACILHDSYDHKYFDSPTDISRVKDNIRQDLEQLNYPESEINDIFTIIENISFSKEFRKRREGKHMDLGVLQHVRDIVSDADKIEAVGISGITRMIQFEETLVSDRTNVLQRHIDHIREHCREKLYLLVADNYIRTPYARKISLKKLEEMKLIVEDDQKLIDFINKELETNNKL